jgi:hypothetical protein
MVGCSNIIASVFCFVFTGSAWDRIFLVEILTRNIDPTWSNFQKIRSCGSALFLLKIWTNISWWTSLFSLVGPQKTILIAIRNFSITILTKLRNIQELKSLFLNNQKMKIVNLGALSVLFRVLFVLLSSFFPENFESRWIFFETHKIRSKTGCGQFQRCLTCLWIKGTLRPYARSLRSKSTLHFKAFFKT